MKGKPKEAVPEARPYARTLFAQFTQPFIIPARDLEQGSTRLVFDLEGNGLLETITCLHCVVIGELDNDHIYEYGPEQIADALAHLTLADTLIGHNIQSYDLPVLRKLHEWTPRPATRLVDTLIAGRLILPHLPDIDSEVAARPKDKAFGQIRGKYSLEAWGVRLGVAKIGAELEDWSRWSPEIQTRCVGDVIINKRLWQFLQPDGYPRAALELEHGVAAICDRIAADGVPFDIQAAERLSESWKVRRAELAKRLHEQFPALKNPNSRQQIAAVLKERGWQPKKLTEKTKQPVIDEELIDSLPDTYPEFTGLSEYHLLGRRLGSLANGKEAWIKHVHDGCIYSNLVHIGTPHSRAKHFGPNVAAVPNPKKGSAFGVECRALFHHPGDWVFVCCDQATLQDRGFAHYLAAYDNGAYARTLVNGTIDQHWHTATALGLVLEARDKSNKEHTVIREGAKTFRYAFLFGAGDLCAGQNIADIVHATTVVTPDSPLCEKILAEDKHPSEAVLRRIGRRARDKFIAATPGLQALRQRLSAEHRRRGWLEGLDGRRIPTGADYKGLNRIVTAAEAVICKRWLIDAYTELCARFRYGPGGDAYLTLWVHDELVVCCRPTIAEQVGKLLVRHACKAGEPYGFRVPLAAEFKIGRDWAGTALEPVANLAPALSTTIQDAAEEIAASEREFRLTHSPIATAAPSLIAAAPAAEEEVVYIDDF